LEETIGGLMNCKSCLNVYEVNAKGFGQCRYLPGVKKVGKKRKCERFTPAEKKPARYFVKEFVSKTKYKLRLLTLDEIKKIQKI